MDVSAVESSATTVNDLDVKGHSGTASIKGSQGNIEGAKDCDPSAVLDAPNIALPGTPVVENAQIVEGGSQDEHDVPCEPQPPRDHTEAVNAQIGT